MITFNSCLPVYFTYFKIPRTACYSTKLRLSSNSTQQSSYISLSISIIRPKNKIHLFCLTYPFEIEEFRGTSFIKSSKNKFIYTHLVRINNEPIKLKSINPYDSFSFHKNQLVSTTIIQNQNRKLKNREREMIKFARRERERERCWRARGPIVPSWPVLSWEKREITCRDNKVAISKRQKARRKENGGGRRRCCLRCPRVFEPAVKRCSRLPAGCCCCCWWCRFSDINARMCVTRRAHRYAHSLPYSAHCGSITI